MDRVEFRCWLDWTALPLVGVEVAVVVTAAGAELAAEGRLVNAGDEDREGFVFLCEADPSFEMRFEDGEILPVTVHDLVDGGRRFALVEDRGAE